MGLRVVDGVVGAEEANVGCLRSIATLSLADGTGATGAVVVADGFRSWLAVRMWVLLRMLLLGEWPWPAPLVVTGVGESAAAGVSGPASAPPAMPPPVPPVVPSRSASKILAVKLFSLPCSMLSRSGWNESWFLSMKPATVYSTWAA